MGTRDDVVAHRNTYLDRLQALRNTHLPPPPPSDERPVTLPPDAEFRKKLVLIFMTKAYLARMKVNVGLGLQVTTR